MLAIDNEFLVHILSFLPLILFLVFLYKWLIFPKLYTKLQLPPSPPKLPIIGHLHQLGKFPHRSLRPLSDKYGELMLLYLGNRPTLVVSSANAAQEILKTHDLIFANRPKLRFVNKIFYDGNDLVFSSYSEKWRQMKSICVMQLLSNKRVQSFRSIREEEVAKAVEKIKSYGGSVFNLSETFLTISKGLLCRTALGKNYSSDNEGGDEFYELFMELTELMGAVSVGDYIPWLGWIDRLNGMVGRVEIVRKKFDEFVEEVLEEHLLRINSNQGNINEKDDKGKSKVKDLVEVLLELHRENPEELSRENIKGILNDVFAAGTETTSTTLEWAMTELLRHPNVMKQLEDEVRSAVKTNTKLTEDDLENMKYLKAVIKETLRLHPPAPLLAFHESSQDVKIAKYDIAAKTQVIINAWAIQRDPGLWHDPEDFNPERFMNDFTTVDYRGQHFQLIPFGAGRRSCPGLSYAAVTIELVLASLIHEFNWTLLSSREGKNLDVEESPGITIKRRNPLLVVATPTNN